MDSTTGKTFISNISVTLEYSTKAPKDNQQIQQQLQEKQQQQQATVTYKDWICVHVCCFY